MNKSLLYAMATVLLCLGCEEKKQTVNYGSNDGKQVRIRGKNIYYEEYGKGIPLLLLSGGGITRSIHDFSPCIPDLSQQFRVIVPDTPGQGRSEQADSLSYEVITDTMSQLIDALNVDSIYVMGWSDGGVAGIMLAERKPDKVKRVIAAGPNNGKRGFNLPPGIPLDSVQPPSLEKFAEWNSKAIEDYSKTPGRDWKKLVNALNEMWYADEYFPVTVYDRIKIPVMIVLGDQDDISIAHGLEMHHAIRRSQFCVLPGTTHDVFNERPALITAIAIDFFNNNEPKTKTQ